MKGRRIIERTMTEENQQTALLRARLNGETARLRWQELQRFFAAGSVIAVDDGLDLVEVALRVATDDKDAVARWMAGNRLGPVSDRQALAWLAEDAELWTVVVKPWILVQREKASQ